MAASSQRSYSEESQRFAVIVRQLRQRQELTLQQLAERSGLAVSTLSKIENSQLSPTYETLLRLADGLGIDVVELFNGGGDSAMASGRRSITRRDTGVRHSTPQYEYEVYCSDLSRKLFVPLVATIAARSREEFPQLPSHDGEEFIYVLSGTVELSTEHYEPVRLKAGDGCYFDSKMKHACISISANDAKVLWITSRGEPPASPKARKRDR